jgi:hypothetical protein
LRSAPAIVVAFAAAVVVALAVFALTSEREQAFTLGVIRSTTVKVAHGQAVCQAPISVPPDAAFDAVTVGATTQARRGAQLELTVRAADAGDPTRAGAVLARGALVSGVTGENVARTVRVGHVDADRTVAVCVTNRSRRPALLYGNVDAAARASSAYADGRPTASDLSLEFQRAEPRTLADLLPAMFDRAALFRAQWVGAWTYWLLALLCVVAVPLLLVRALRSAVRDSSGV